MSVNYPEPLKDECERRTKEIMNSNINIILKNVGNVSNMVAEDAKQIDEKIVDPIIDFVAKRLEQKKQDDLEYAMYQSKDIKQEDILHALKDNYDRAGANYGVFECQKVSKDTLKGFIDKGYKVDTPTSDEMEMVRPDMVGSCCFAKKISLDNFMKITIPVSVSVGGVVV